MVELRARFIESLGSMVRILPLFKVNHYRAFIKGVV